MNVTKMVIPVAGYGTRFLPFTKSVPKEMLPIVNKPLVDLAVREAIKSGITDILFITYRGKSAIEDYFDHNVELESALKKKGKDDFLSDITYFDGKVKVSFIRQRKMTGFAHAIYLAKDFVGQCPFAVLLPDDLIAAEKPVTKQLVDFYIEQKKSVVALTQLPMEEVSAYGVVSCIEKHQKYVLIDKVVEKPKVEEAPSNLTIVGRYVFDPMIFDCIDNISITDSGEAYMTDAIELLAKKDGYGVCGLLYDGMRFDVGRPEGFVAANNYYYNNPHFLE